MTASPFDAATLPVPVESPQLIIRALGEPVPQGSMQGFKRGAKVVLVPSNQAALAVWRDAVADAARSAALAARWVRFDGACQARIDFWLPRPAAAERRRDPFKPPDLDKLVRGVLDALTASAVVVDDSRIVLVTARKRYEQAGRPPGVRVVLTNGMPDEIEGD